MFLAKEALRMRTLFFKTGDHHFLRAWAALSDEPVPKRSNWIDDRPRLFRMAVLIYTGEVEKVWPAAMQVASEIGCVSADEQVSIAKRLCRKFNEVSDFYMVLAPHAGHVGPPYEHYLRQK